MILEKSITFLSLLNDNNNLNWMHSHKDLKEEAQYEFQLFLDALIAKIQTFDKTIEPMDSKKLLFRLNRDIRFSHNKSPYNPSFRAHIGPKGKQFIPAGYYLQVDPKDDFFLTKGVYATQFPEATAMVRDYIVAHGEELTNIINNNNFKHYFQLSGFKLKNCPRGYDKESPYVETTET